MFFRKLKSFAKDYFTLTSRERKGALALAGIILLQITAIIIIHYLLPPDDMVIHRYKMKLAEFENNLAKPEKTQAAKNTNLIPVVNFEPFDPNTIPDEKWMEMGLSRKQTNVIRNYLNKGGHFRDKESLAKIYSITNEQFARLEPYIVISQKPFRANLPVPKKTGKVSMPLIEINSADTIDLIKLPLVGAGRARMIYKYRERLGGFHSQIQLLEVFTIDSAVYMAITPYLTIDPDKIRTFRINSDTLIHPYLPRKTASAIVAYRKQHGNYGDINDLRKVALIDEQLLQKLVPYVSFE